MSQDKEENVAYLLSLRLDLVQRGKICQVFLQRLDALLLLLILLLLALAFLLQTADVAVAGFHLNPKRHVSFDGQQFFTSQVLRSKTTLLKG